MNINIFLSNGMSDTVDLVCYFTGNNGKNYLFYTKNETVQDGLIKMYVASEIGAVDDTEWTNLKKDMQQIIMGTSTVKFLNYSNPIRIREARAIALNNTNISSIKNAYSKNIGISGETNKDLLSQSFGDTPKVEVQNDPVQINPIPAVQNNFNMENTPVNMNVNPEPVMSVTDSVPKIEPINSVLNPNPTNDEVALNINSVKPAGIESGFKVSNEPNIFDQPRMPFNITEEDINKPIENMSTNNAFNGNADANNIFNTVSEQPTVNNTVNKIENQKEVNVNRQIELNERKIKLFTELANIYKEENEMLSESTLSNNTASDLFNNNGTLDDLKILQG